MKRILTTLAFAGALVIGGGTAFALECDSDKDCPEGQQCMSEPCAAIACDPDDPNCEQPDCPDTGECVEGGGGGWSSDCETDADCPEGWACEVVGGFATVCPNGEDCPEAESGDILGCKPAPCDTDADCGGSLVCLTYTQECATMGGGGMVPCAEGEDCGAPPEEEEPCEPETIGVCGPKWAGPCEVDADCGDNFKCVEEIIEECSSGGSDGGSGTPTDPDPPPVPEEEGDGDDEGGADDPPGKPVDTDPPQEPDCEEVKTGDMICEPNEISCNAADDCPNGWSCEQKNVSTTSVDCPPGVDCGDPEPEEPVQSEGLCLPEDWNNWSGGGSSGVDLSGTANKEEAKDPPADPNAQNIDGEQDGSGGGCQSGQSQGGLLLSLLALGLVVLTRRRRADMR